MALKSKQTTNTLRGNRMHGGQTPPGWTDAQANVARQVMVEFMAQGATAAGASGVVGNWYQESSLDPTAGGGYLAQWIGSRVGALRSFASTIGAPVTSVEAQSRFAISELKSSYPNLWHTLTTTKDPKAAALAISQQYERPAAWAANNTNRQNQAATAYQYLAGGINAGSVSQIGGAGGDSGGGGSGPSSVLDLLTSPIDQLGGWLAGIAFGLVKNTAIFIADDLIIPFWHWNQRATATYTQNLKGNQLLWTSAFWGFGYTLLFTDPNSGNLRPASVRRSRLARHTRTVQSLPARMSLTRPKDVARKTLVKPKPRISRAPIIQTGTMQAVRRYPVHVSGTHARRDTGEGTRSEVPIERAGTLTASGEKPRDGNASPPSGKSHADDRTGNSSLPDSSRVTGRGTGSRRDGRR